MPCPSEGIEAAAFGNNIDVVRDALEAKHSRNYRIYNLANKTYRKEKLYQVLDVGSTLVSNVRAPPITLMLKLCSNVVKFLNERLGANAASASANTCCVIVSCGDGKAVSAIAVATLLVYCRALRNVDACVRLFNAKRFANVQLTPAQLRYLKYTEKLLSACRHDPESVRRAVVANECLLLSVTLVGVPLFNRMRNGCTPIVEVYNRDKKIFSNANDYDQMKFDRPPFLCSPATTTTT